MKSSCMAEGGWPGSPLGSLPAPGSSDALPSCRSQTCQAQLGRIVKADREEEGASLREARGKWPEEGPVLLRPLGSSRFAPDSFHLGGALAVLDGEDGLGPAGGGPGGPGRAGAEALQGQAARGPAQGRLRAHPQRAPGEGRPPGPGRAPDQLLRPGLRPGAGRQRPRGCQLQAPGPEAPGSLRDRCSQLSSALCAICWCHLRNKWESFYRLLQGRAYQSDCFG